MGVAVTEKAISLILNKVNLDLEVGDLMIYKSLAESYVIFLYL